MLFLLLVLFSESVRVLTNPLLTPTSLKLRELVREECAVDSPGVEDDPPKSELGIRDLAAGDVTLVVSDLSLVFLGMSVKLSPCNDVVDGDCNDAAKFN